MDLMHALRLSNDAVMLLLWPSGADEADQQKNFDKALSYFSGSLQEIKALHTTTNAADGDASSRDIKMADKESSVSFSFCNFSTLRDSNETDCYLYNTAILFNLPEQCTNDTASSATLSSTTSSRSSPVSSLMSSQVEAFIYSAFIMLNIALAYHQRALNSPLGKHRTSQLQKAETLYGIVARNLYSKASILHGNAANTTSNMKHLKNTANLVKAAAINNLSQLQYRRCDYMESFRGFQFLGSLIADTFLETDRSSCSMKEEGCSRQNTEIYQCMLLNVYFLHPPTVAAAA